MSETRWTPSRIGVRTPSIWRTFGNGAAGQVQHDLFGVVMQALLDAREAGLPAERESWSLQRALIAHLAATWDQPDDGIWEVRGGRRHFTFSKVMAWVAIDRSIEAAERHGLTAPLAEWRTLRRRIHAAVCAHGLDPARGCFTQSFGSTALDASLLQLPLLGFLPASDSRVAATVAAIEQELMPNGLVLRYDTRAAVDGLPPGEGAFLA